MDYEKLISRLFIVVLIYSIVWTLIFLGMLPIGLILSNIPGIGMIDKVAYSIGVSVPGVIGIIVNSIILIFIRKKIKKRDMLLMSVIPFSGLAYLSVV